MLKKVEIRALILSFLAKDLAETELFSNERYYLARAFSQKDRVKIFTVAAEMYAEAIDALNGMEEGDDKNQIDFWIERLSMFMDLIPIPSDHELRGNIRFLTAVIHEP